MARARAWTAFHPVQWAGRSRPGGHERVDRRTDDRLEEPAGEVKAADEARARCSRESLCISHDVHRTGVGAAGDDHEALAVHVDDHVLVVPDHRIGLPAGVRPRVVDREALLELRRPFDLSRDENPAVEQQRLPRSSTTSSPSASRSPRLGGGRRSSAPVGKTTLRSRHASGWITSGSLRRPNRRKSPSSRRGGRRGRGR